MKRQDAERLITEYLKPVYGFALKRCKTEQDAEDLAQEIILKAFGALLAKDDVASPDKFIWTVAHNTLSNYYRDGAKSASAVSLDEIAEVIAAPDSEEEAREEAAAIRRLQGEIAYLSKLQRRIVIAYYFENRKQADIARELGIPLGTVKWHLFEAKKELKRGMETMRKHGELKFNPIKFHSYGINGSSGTMSTDEFFRSTLSQNIGYCVRRTPKTVAEIADELGVSPVYVESEAEFLAEYGFLLEQKGKYLANFVISEPTVELLTMQDAMYKEAAALFANDLYDELTASGLLDHPSVLCGQSDEPITLTSGHRTDHNFLLWSLIPYVAARSGEGLMERHVSFEEVATLRPDGAHNIFHAAVLPDRMPLPEDYVYMRNWCGPMWNQAEGWLLWQVDSTWSGRAYYQGFETTYSTDARRVLSLYAREYGGDVLSKDEYAWLCEKGYVKVCGDPDGCFKSAWQIVALADKEVQAELLAMGESIQRKHKQTFDGLKAAYVEAVLETVPPHMRKVKAYELQFIFHSDGWFLLHCLVALLNNGKLKPPTEGQRKALTTVIAPA